jgi:hypothetical protein
MTPRSEKGKRATASTARPFFILFEKGRLYGPDPDNRRYQCTRAKLPSATAF